MIGEPALPAGFDHLPYVNPEAPKGGRITYGVVGTFDSMNPFIVQGGTTSSRGLADPMFGNLVYESLLMRSSDEPFTLYGLIAETVETPPDRSWVEFQINPKAKFSDGEPITPDDVIFSMELLRDRGRPNYKAYFSKVEKMEKVGDRGVRFDMAGAGDRELPLIIGLMPILPRHAINVATFDKSTLTPMIGSGPYLPVEVKAPDHIVYKRNPDYWAKDLPIKRGFDNYDEIRIEYYRDASTMFEAFKKGLYDVQPEGDPAAWNTNYDFPAVADGRVVKESYRTGTPKGMSGFLFNTRRPIFADIRVRKALAKLFDFEWVNKNLYYGAYVRAAGYFNDSDLSSIGRPASDREKALLAPYPGIVDPAVMDGTYRPQASDGSGSDRKVLREALSELQAAGYELRGNALTNKATGQPLTFEIMVTTKEDERLALAYMRTLQRIGITASIRNVDAAQYQERRNNFDFDVIRYTWAASLSPGNEQIYRWGSAAADQNGSFNYPGAKVPALDALIQAMLSAPTREDFVAAVRAFDRVLISEAYAVPLFYLPDQWIARWTRIEHPDKTPIGGYVLPAWWAKAGP
ncbi:MAG: ABC transporter substrate-binding protein [Rhizobiales bacterium]|nr:ABC transporter substrate-binding protein [Hyphomicrobiales bacterium]MBN9010365.1 ABC transporter substrate-binding protein [Hyphomicrobiales bacterium]